MNYNISTFLETSSFGWLCPLSCRTLWSIMHQVKAWVYIEVSHRHLQHYWSSKYLAGLQVMQSPIKLNPPLLQTDCLGFHVCSTVGLTLATRPQSKSFHQNNTQCERDASLQRVIDGACALLWDALPGPSRRFCRGWQVRKITCWSRGPSWGRLQAQTGNASDLLESLPDSKSATCWKFQPCVAEKDPPSKSSRWH